LALLALVAAAAAVAIGCEAGPPRATPAITPGTSAAPREVNIIAKDWIFLPDRIVVVPGETVLLHVVNGGLDVHEAVIGDGSVQDAWEVAEAATVGSPPGPTPLVSVPPAVSGLRVVVASGQRVDALWHVPESGVAGLVVGCHIPGHWAKGMVVPVEPLAPSGGPSLGPSADRAVGPRAAPEPIAVVRSRSALEPGPVGRGEQSK
jgi:uncharacterized cupredoxin-like copper-binding protein